VVLDYARNTKIAGLDGVVCSPLEAKLIHDNLGDDFKTICPGIRLDSSNDDQVRITSPSIAKELTCDYIVVGRPITRANNPREVYELIKKDFEV
jgi:orotidine-5'-phosphate decarboxylase